MTNKMRLPRNIRRTIQVGNRWKKGESGKSNPDIRIHRDANSNGVFLKPANVKVKGKLPLTTKALEHLNIAADDKEVLSRLEDDRVSVAETFRSWATNVTQCTNPVFDRLHEIWTGNTAQQREALAVLAGVRQTITEKGGIESSTEYFAALLLCLETVDDAATVNAVTYLLKLVMAHGVPEAVLRKTYGRAVKTFVMALEKSSSNEDQVLTTNMLIYCLGHLLRVQGPEVWTYSSTLQVYTRILHFITHEKSSLRKAAHKSLAEVVRGWSNLYASSGSIAHPACTETERFTTHLLKEEKRTVDGSSSTCNRILYAMDFLKEVLPVFPASKVQTSCEAMLEVMRMPNPLIHCKVLEVIKELFQSRPSESTLPMKLSGQLCTALYSRKGSTDSPDIVCGWLDALMAGIDHMMGTEGGVTTAEHHAIRIFAEIVALFSSESRDVKKATMLSANRLMDDVLPNLVNVVSNKSIEAMFNSLKSALSYQYVESWRQILALVTSFIRVWGPAGTGPIGQVLTQLAELRDTRNVQLVDETDRVFAAAIKQLGPRAVLKAVPMKIAEEMSSGKFEFSRSWVIPLLRESVSCTSASQFLSDLLPLANQARETALRLEKEDRGVHASVCYLLSNQLWSLLPGYCTEPSDWGQLKGLLAEMARRLDEVETPQNQVRGHVLLALKKLVSSVEYNEEAASVMKMFAKVFIPKLLSLYEVVGQDTNEVNRTKQQLSGVLQAYLPLVNKKVLHNAAERTLSQAVETKEPVYFDLLAIMAPSLARDSITEIWMAMMPFMKDDNHTIQKKAYRFLEEVCKGTSECCKGWTQHNLNSILECLEDALEHLKPPVKKARLHIFLALLKAMEKPHIKILNILLPETLMSMDDINMKTRESCDNLLTEMVVALARWRPADQPELNADDDDELDDNEVERRALGEALSLFLRRLWPILRTPGPDKTLLAQNTGRAVTALFRSRRLAWVVTEEHCVEVLEACSKMLASKSKGLATGGFALMKVMAKFAGRKITVAQYFEPLHKLNPSFGRGLRFSVKKCVFRKLIHRFNYDSLKRQLPTEFHKQLKNTYRVNEVPLKKTEEFYKGRVGDEAKDKESESDDGATTTAFGGPLAHTTDITDILGSDDSDDEYGADKKKRKVSTPSNKGWLEERTGEVLDLTDAAQVSQRLHTGIAPPGGTLGGPMAGNKRRAAEAFPMRNGKMIIREEKEPSEKGGSDDDMIAVDDRLTPGLIEQLGPAAPSSSRTQKSGGQTVTAPGAKYRSNRAAGDMKKVGQPDPYAYLPLGGRGRPDKDKRLLKLVKTVHKGVAKGRKAAVKAGSQARSKKMGIVKRGIRRV